MEGVRRLVWRGCLVLVEGEGKRRVMKSRRKERNLELSVSILIEEDCPIMTTRFW